MAAYLNKDYEIYDDNGDASIKVTAEDFMVRVKTYDDDKSKDWFGEFDLFFTLDVAQALVKAISMTVEDIKTLEKELKID